MKQYIPHLGRQAPDYDLVRKAADQVLKENVITSAPVPIREIAENYVSKVLFAGLPDSLSNVMGFYDPAASEIVVNRDDPPNRQTFTIAHELGHAVLHKDFVLNHPDEYKVLLRTPVGAQKDPIEQEANAFASALLVPRRFLDQYYKIASVSELAQLFNVSAEVIRWRLHNEYKLTTA